MKRGFCFLSRFIVAGYPANMADLTVTAANVDTGDATAVVVDASAGSAITAGQALALNASGDPVPADVTDATTHKIVGIALNSAPGAGQPVRYVRQDSTFNPGATLVVGTVYGLGSTAGAIAPVADQSTNDYSNVLFIAVTASTAKLNVTQYSYGGLIP